ncbi:MAG: hypothetical protein A4E63_01420 [Syntrophorhabdus sp. PtaU1.Bin050]|nr:MAG: hypothetical protein A4E63_01420 [Syntrophorhabdus sp. PtaU1.Bin050]
MKIGNADDRFGDRKLNSLWNIDKFRFLELKARPPRFERGAFGSGGHRKLFIPVYPYFLH